MKPQRGPHEANSPFGQWVHDHVPRDFDVRDVDGVHFSVATGIERSFESKDPEQNLKPSQWRGLGNDALKVKLMVDSGRLKPGSGVWIVWFDYEQETVTEIREMRPSGRPTLPLYPWSVRVRGLVDFIRCRGSLPPIDAMGDWLVEGDQRWSGIVGGPCQAPDCPRDAAFTVEGVRLCELCHWKVGEPGPRFVRLRATLGLEPWFLRRQEETSRFMADEAVGGDG